MRGGFGRRGRWGVGFSVRGIGAPGDHSLIQTGPTFEHPTPQSAASPEGPASTSRLPLTLAPLDLSLWGLRLPGSQPDSSELNPPPSSCPPPRPRMSPATPHRATACATEHWNGAGATEEPTFLFHFIPLSLSLSSTHGSWLPRWVSPLGLSSNTGDARSRTPKSVE